MLSGKTIIAPNILHEVKTSLIKNLGLKKAEIEIKYDSGLFNPAAAMTIIDELKIRSSRINGFFDGADVSISGDTITYKIRNGGYTAVASLGLEKEIADVIEMCIRDRPKHLDKAIEDYSQRNRRFGGI